MMKQPGAWNPVGVVQRAVQEIKQTIPEMVVITDLCACEYTTHGHCGYMGECHDGIDLMNDDSLELMEKIAISHADAGADNCSTFEYA